MRFIERGRQQRRWIAAEWGISDNNRKAKFYSITKRACAR
jgi:hypothetical protein